MTWVRQGNYNLKGNKGAIRGDQTESTLGSSVNSGIKVTGATWSSQLSGGPRLLSVKCPVPFQVHTLQKSGFHTETKRPATEERGREADLQYNYNTTDLYFSAALTNTREPIFPVFHKVE